MTPRHALRERCGLGRRVPTQTFHTPPRVARPTKPRGTEIYHGGIYHGFFSTNRFLATRNYKLCIGSDVVRRQLLNRVRTRR